MADWPLPLGIAHYYGAEFFTLGSGFQYFFHPLGSRDYALIAQIHLMMSRLKQPYSEIVSMDTEIRHTLFEMELDVIAQQSSPSNNDLT